MTLNTHFDSVQPREKAGSTSSDRFHYQKTWALCQLLKLHSEGSDYLIAFDIHDDVVVFEPEDSPNTIRFFQVKTKKGKTAPAFWTLRALLSRRKGTDGKQLSSILGKLYDDALLFPEFTRELTFVSNAPFRITLGPDNKTALLLSDARTPFKKIADINKKTIRQALQTEHALPASPILDDLLWLEQSEIPLDAHATFAKGRLAEFLEQRKPGKYNAPLAYRVLIDEVGRKNDYSQQNLDFSTMRRLKAIGRSDFEQILQDAVPDDTAERTWPEVASSLQLEGFGLRERIALHKSWERVAVYRSDSSNSAFWELVKLSKPISEQYGSLQTLLTEGLLALKQQSARTISFDDEILKSLLLMTAHDLL